MTPDAPSAALPARPIAVGVADVGHPEHSDGTSHFGAWLIDTRRWSGRAFKSPEEFGTAAGALARAGHRLLLGYECPCTTTVGPYGVERPEEARYDRPWWRGAGGAVTILGLSQVPHILTTLHEVAGRPLTATVDAMHFMGEETPDVLLFEAFVTGAAKPGPPPPGWTHGVHVWDAWSVAIEVAATLSAGEPLQSNTEPTDAPPLQRIPVMNLLVAGALAAGLDINPEEITHQGLIVRPPAKFTADHYGDAS